MSQITVRAPEELVERVKQSSARHGQSMNEWVVTVLDAATNPDFAEPRAEQIRERLRLGGLLLEVDRRAVERPTRKELRAIAARAAGGRPLSEYVVEDRG
jgi:plasmid stability protein